MTHLARQPTGEPQPFWWSRPSLIAFLGCLPLYFFCSSLSELSYSLYGHPTKYLRDIYFYLGLFALISFTFFSFIGERSPEEHRSPRVDPQRMTCLIFVLYALVLAAYFIFLSPILFSPQILLEHLSGSSSTVSELRHVLLRVPGLTSLMALQSLCVILTLSYEDLCERKPHNLIWGLLACVIICCILRAWLWSERLALIEVAIPAVIILLAPWKRMSQSNRLLLNTAPIVGAAFVFLLFAAGEYFRSWQFYKNVLPYSFFEFVWIRFLGYYATALANGAVAFEHLGPYYSIIMTGDWYHKFPLWSWLNSDSFTQTNPTGLESYYSKDFLKTYLNPEFNNLSGLFAPAIDFGPVLGVCIWGTLGYYSGRLFKRFVSGHLFARLFFPIWFVGVCEMMRLFYWGETRFFPMFIGVLLATLYLKRNYLFGSTKLALQK